MKKMHRAWQQRAGLAAAYLLLALAAALGWLYSSLPDRVYLEPGQALSLPRFQWGEPQSGHGSQNVACTRAVGSYQTTLTLGGCRSAAGVRVRRCRFLPGLPWMVIWQVRPAAGLILLGCEVLYFSARPGKCRCDFSSVVLCLLLMGGCVGVSTLMLVVQMLGNGYTIHL